MGVVEFPLDSGGTLRVRLATAVDEEDDVAGPVLRGGSVQQRLAQAGETFESALAPIRTVAEAVMGQLVDLPRAPDKVQVEFGLELTASAGALLAAAGGSAHLHVALTWRGPGTA